MCGHCGQPNTDVDRFPFVNRCSNPACLLEPKAYKCHYDDCQELIFLTKDEDKRNFASRLRGAFENREKSIKHNVPVESEETRRKKEIDEFSYKIEKARREAELVQAEAYLKKLRGERTPFEDDAKSKHREKLGRFEYARKMLEEAEGKYKNDPERLEQEKAFWEEWKEDLSI